jgi:hypothetical protein
MSYLTLYLKHTEINVIYPITTTTDHYDEIFADKSERKTAIINPQS